jgi:hypothetical protein
MPSNKRSRKKTQPSDATIVPLGDLKYGLKFDRSSTENADARGEEDYNTLRKRNDTTKKKRFKYVPDDDSNQKRFSFSQGITARTYTTPFWATKPIIMAKYIASIFSVAAIGCILWFLFLWLIGWMPFYPNEVGQYAAVFVIIPLAAYIIGAAMWISESIEFFALSLLLQFIALMFSTYMFASLFYLWYLCITFQNGPACVNPYIVDTVMYFLLLAYWLSGMISTGAHIVIVARSSQTTSTVESFGPPS